MQLLPLGALINLRRGHDLTILSVSAGNIPVIGSNGIIGYHNKATTPAPCLTIGRSGSVGKLFYSEVDSWAHNTTLYVDDFKGNNPKYIYYLLKNLDLAYLHSGSVVPSLNRNYLHPLLIKATLDTHIQDGIAAVLSSLDAKIELNNRINAELEAMAKTLYDYWFVQFNFPNAEGKPYKSNGGKMVWNEELKREIPERWEVGSLLDIADYANGLPCQKYRPIGKESLRVIKIKEMHEGFSSDTELVRPNIPQKAIIENGDVLFSWSASLEVQFWTGGKGALNQHIFKVTSEKFPKSFYYFQLINYLQHFKMMAEKRKTTMGHITQDHLEQSRVTLPTRLLAEQLEKILVPVFNKKKKNELENKTLSELRDWLLPMLMNGQVKVN
jgi:type I restriction enzyme S subunit